MIVFLCSIPSFKSANLYPVLGNGVNQIFFNGLSNIYAFSGITLLFFILPYLKKKEDYRKISILGITISSILLFLSAISILLSFPISAITEESLSFYWLVRTINFGRFFQRIDSIYILMWIICVLSFVSINLFFVTLTLKKMANLHHLKILEYIFAIAVFVGVYLLKNTQALWLAPTNLFKYYFIILILGFCPLILIFANVKIKRDKKGENL